MAESPGVVPVSKEVDRIAEQAEQKFRENGCRWDTYFYKVVLAGNVKIIKQVVEHMEQQGSAEALDWLFTRKKYEERRHLIQKSGRLMLMRILLFLIMSVITILLTPFFYALHILSCSFLNRKHRRISGNIQLPLAYAAFSQSKEMLIFFLSQGVELEHVDHHGNNIFHYISDLSSVAADTAIQVFCSTVREIDDRDSIKQLLEYDRNSAGLTAVEYAAKFGSPSLLNHILQQPGIMHHTLFSATADHVLLDEGSPDDVSSPPASAVPLHEGNSSARTRMELVDVSRYEAGDLADQSSLLNILSDRDVAGMGSPELQIFSDTHFIGKWLSYKCKQMIPGVLLFQSVDFIITSLLVFVLATTFTGSIGFSLQYWYSRELSNVKAAEVEAWGENSSMLLTNGVFWSRSSKEALLLDMDLWYNLWMHDMKGFQELLNVTSYLPETDDRDEQLWKLIDIVHAFNDTDLLTLAEHAFSMPRYSNYTKCIEQYPDILVKIGKGLTARKSDVHEILFSFILHDIVDNVTLNDGREKLSEACPKLPYGFCYDLSNAEELRVPPDMNFEEMREHAGDACRYQVFVNLAGKCKTADRLSLLKRLYPKEYSYVGGKIVNVAVICTYLYILLDIVERCVFLTTCVVHQSSARDIVITALGQKVPGSYMRKQLNLLSCIIIPIYYHVYIFTDEMYMSDDSSDSSFYAMQVTLTNVFIIAVVSRFLMHIHSLRLLPGIGHFVITTFMMGTNLLHFSAVFGIVLLIFSLLFHILIDDPDCPLEKAEGFVTLQDSIFSTFQLTFGHGNLAPFFSSAPVKLTYVLYVIIVGLLLLNLIIAIMSSTATDIMAEPWREVLWKVEWLDEATSVEYTFSVLTLPFRRLRLYCFHQKAGYIVKKMPGKKHKIYIECFHCPALELKEKE